MNEEQAVLDFFAKPENLPLGLSVSRQMDEIKQTMNSDFWTRLTDRLSIQMKDTLWQIQTTEDRNTQDMLVGLQFKLNETQNNSLFPMMEQQYLGGQWRIFYGLMWQTAPGAEQLASPEIIRLKSILAESGFKANENFPGWQWSQHYPRRSDFLLRFSQNPEALLSEIENIFTKLLDDNGELIDSINKILKVAPQATPVSLSMLRRNQV